MCVKGHFDPHVQIDCEREVSDDDTPLHKNVFKLDLEWSINYVFLSMTLSIKDKHMFPLVQMDVHTEEK